MRAMGKNQDTILLYMRCSQDLFPCVGSETPCRSSQDRSGAQGGPCARSAHISSIRFKYLAASSADHLYAGT